MERTPSKSGEEDDSSSKKRPAIERYFSKVVRPVESLRLIPDPETKPEVRRVVPLIPEAIVLFDRHDNSQAKDGKESEKPADADKEEGTTKSPEEDEEETTTEETPFKKPFRPVIPRVPVATLLRPPETKPIEVVENQKDHAAELPDTTEVVSASGVPEQSAPAAAAFESQSGSLIDAFGELPIIEDYAEDGDDQPSMPAATSTALPRYTVPSPNTQAATANQWPHYNYYSPNTPPPPPSGATGGTGQPPIPPRPSAGMGMGGVPPLNPNVYPLAAAGGAGPNYNTANTAPAPANLPIAPTGERRIGSDPLARLMGVGNWIGNRRTRKKLGNRIDQLQSDTGKSMADLQSRQTQFEQKQRSQSQEVQRMQMQAERSGAAAVPLTAESVPRVPAQRIETPRLATPGRPQAAEMQPPVPTGQETVDQRLNPETKQQSTTWLNLEVDKRGNVVSNTQEFGQGFHQERQQEVQRDRPRDSAAAGAVSLLGVQQDQHAPIRYDSSLPNGLTPPTLPGGMPTHIDPQHQLLSENKKTSGVPGPVFWIMLAIIVAAFFAAAFI